MSKWQHGHARAPLTRIWETVNKTETCWNWTGNTDKAGYGLLSNGKGKDGLEKGDRPCLRTLYNYQTLKPFFAFSSL